MLAIRCALFYAQAVSPPGCIERQLHDLQIYVDAIKVRTDQTAILEALVLDVGSPGCGVLAGRRLRLSWYAKSQLPARGTELSARVKLRIPWGQKNPGGFDYGLWLVGRSYIASGYIKSVAAQSPAPEPSPRLTLDQHRYVHADLLNAILLGQRDAVSDQHWQLFRDTGTIHLMVISGLHVGVFTGLIYLLSFALLRLLPMRRGNWRAKSWACGLSLISVALLVYQTGLQTPVVRAAMMAAVFMLALLLLRRVPWWRCFALVAWLAVMFSPQVLVQHGFWLSYTAVFVLLVYFAPRRPRPAWARGLLACQAVLLLTLSPWLGITVGEVPAIATLANLLAVPPLTAVTIPLGMLGALLSAVPGLAMVGHGCLLIADFSVALVLEVLTRLQGRLPTFGYFSWREAGLSFVAGLALTLPLARRYRLLLLAAWLTLLLPKRSDVDYGEFRVQMLDVGQGSSAVIDTQHHRMILDTGAAFASGFNYAEAAVIPALRATGPDRLDRVLISHPDNDHAGGVDQIAQRYPSARITGLRAPCKNAERWQWDGVELQLLVNARGRTRNDRSCTLLIDNGKRVAFFAGDISRLSEQLLLPKLPVNIDLLLAPHHGSATSSSPELVRHLAPRIVVFSAGRKNQYRHPRKQVVQRYLEIGARTFDTARDGAISWRSDAPDRVRTWR